jgi:hypothetical protein
VVDSSLIRAPCGSMLMYIMKRCSYATTAESPSGLGMGSSFIDVLFIYSTNGNLCIDSRDQYGQIITVSSNPAGFVPKLKNKFFSVSKENDHTSAGS